MAAAKRKKPAKKKPARKTAAAKKSTREEVTQDSAARPPRRDKLAKARGSSPRLLYFPSKTSSYLGASELLGSLGVFVRAFVSADQLFFRRARRLPSSTSRLRTLSVVAPLSSDHVVGRMRLGILQATAAGGLPLARSSQIGKATAGRRAPTPSRVIRLFRKIAHLSSPDAAAKPSLWINIHRAFSAASSFASIRAAQHHIGAETFVLEERVAADLNLGMRGLEFGEARSGVAFGHVETDRAGQDRPPLGETRGHRVEHDLHDAGHAGHDDDVLEHEARRPGDGVVDQGGASRDAGHAQPRRRELLAR